MSKQEQQQQQQEQQQQQQQQQQQKQHHNHGITLISLSSSTDNQDIIITTTTTTTTINNTHTTTTPSPILMMSLTKKRGIFPKPATNIMRTWLFHHLTGGSYVVFPGDESLSICGSLNDDGGRESVLSEGNTGSGGGSATGTNKRKVPKVFSKEAITKFRAWLFQNLTAYQA
uniref:PaO domain-containing protein n=1 Tax=Loa loa TaxID=7209 RepID=A0A1I7VGL6_LOALO